MPEQSASGIHAVLLAGGMGARLWPISRELFPKQLVRFFGNRSLIQHTLQRLHPVIPRDRLTVVCGKVHFHEIYKQIQDMGIDPRGKILCEPCGRNTAPAILLALLDVVKNGEDPVLCVFPSDHVIRDENRFHEKVAAAIRLAERGNIVTFGITPHYPETGYGYIEGGKKTAEGARHIRRFVEKPDARRARGYLESGRFYWNSGMFAFQASVMLKEYQAFQPEMWRQMRRCLREGAPASTALYADLEKISIDFAVMEHTRRGVVLPSDFGWSDIGSWKSLFDFMEKDPNGNIFNGDVLARETRGCLVMGAERLVVTNHLTDTVVIETPDSIFVSDMENSRDVKFIVKQLQERGRKESRQHRTQLHAWGRVTVLEETPDSRVLRVDVDPRKTYRLVTKKGWHQCLTLISGDGCIRQKSGPEVRLRDPEAPFASVTGRASVKNTSETTLRLVQTETANLGKGGVK